jgi:hypothetical protein
MESLKRNARIAGLLYPVMGIPAVFSYLYVHNKLMVHGDAMATAQRITGSEGLFRLGIASELLSVIAFLFLGCALYRVFREVDKGYAFLMVILVAASVPLSFANVWNETAVLTLLQPPGFLSAASLQRESLAMMFLTLHMDGLRLAAIFWGLWLFPFGVLVMRSGFLPKIFGVLLILACLGWVADTLVWILAPQYSNAMDMAANVIGGFGEIPISLWLLVVGVSNRRNSTSRL